MTEPEVNESRRQGQGRWKHQGFDHAPDSASDAESIISSGMTKKQRQGRGNITRRNSSHRDYDYKRNAASPFSSRVPIQDRPPSLHLDSPTIPTPGVYIAMFIFSFVTSLSDRIKVSSTKTIQYHSRKREQRLARTAPQAAHHDQENGGRTRPDGHRTEPQSK